MVFLYSALCLNCCVVFEIRGIKTAESSVYITPNTLSQYLLEGHLNYVEHSSIRTIYVTILNRLLTAETTFPQF